MKQYTFHVGEKFNEDGSLRYFPGATIISMLDESNLMHPLMTRIRQTALDSDFAKDFTFLPPSSFHMTVFDLYSDFERYEPKWSSKIDRLLPAAEVNKILAEAYQNIPAPKEFRMKVDYVDANSIKLLPANQAAKKSLKDYRDKISENTGIRFSNHETYQYHMTFGYPLSVPADDIAIKRFITEQTFLLKKNMGEFSIGRPVFCTYATMEEFTEYSG